MIKITSKKYDTISETAAKCSLRKSYLIERTLSVLQTLSLRLFA